MSFPAFAALDREWRWFRSKPTTVATLARWKEAEPDLVGFTDVDELIAMRHDPDRGPAVLTALVRLAHEDPIAARVLLQAVMPGLVRLCVRLSDERRPNIAEHALAVAWERIRSYGAGNRTSFAPNLLLDVRKALVAEWSGESSPADLPAPASAPPAEHEALARLFVAELAAMESDGRLQPGSTELIFQTRVEGHTLVEVAARLGNVTEHGLLLRRQRAEARLRRQLTAA